MSATPEMFTLGEGIIDRPEFYKRLSQLNFPTVTTNKKITYYNVPAGFDIETTSYFDESGNRKGTMYHWQFGIFNLVTTGRSWPEFLNCLTAVRAILGLGNETRLVVYIHNISFEWQFMRKWIEWDKVFFLDTRNPIYALSDGIEFRDMFKLSRKSLAKTAEDLVNYPTMKMIGDLDYSLYRHSLTPLTDIELRYCEQDIRVILSYIQEKIETDGDITKIPLTNTGYVRNYCRTACFQKVDYVPQLDDRVDSRPD